MLIDRVFKRIGLNGRAVIPMVLGFGCDTMATVVTRTLESSRERIIATLLLALAIPCSAQMGVILGLLSGVPGALMVWLACMVGVFLLVGLLAAVGALMLYSAANGSVNPWATRHLVRFGLGLALMLGIAGITLVYLAVNASYLAVLGFEDARACDTPAAEVVGRGDTSGWWQSLRLNKGLAATAGGRDSPAGAYGGTAVHQPVCRTG